MVDEALFEAVVDLQASKTVGAHEDGAPAAGPPERGGRPLDSLVLAGDPGRSRRR